MTRETAYQAIEIHDQLRRLEYNLSLINKEDVSVAEIFDYAVRVNHTLSLNINLDEKKQEFKNLVVGQLNKEIERLTAELEKL